MNTAIAVKDLRLEAPNEILPAVLDPWARYEGCLIGRVFNHPRMSDGKIVVTTRVLKLDAKAGYAKTLNTHYKLGNKRTADEIFRLHREMRCKK